MSLNRFLPMSIKQELKHSQIVSGLFMFITNKQLRRKATDIIMLHDRINTGQILLYNTITKKVKVVFLLSHSDDLIKSISEYNIILFMNVSRITDKLKTKLII